jgi:isopenicillin N synthase-like dioxygenase
MSSADVKTIAVEEIPVIDASPLLDGSADGAAHVGAQMREAAESSGFFYISEHGIDQSVMDEAFAVSAEFFAMPRERKNEVLVSEHHRGYLTVGEAKMEGQQKIDLKESYVWGLDVDADDPDFAAGNVFLAPNRWPDDYQRMRTALNAYLDAANACGRRVLSAFAAGLGIEPDYFIRRFDKPISRGALIHYPPQPETLGGEQYGVSPHTDFGTITLLAQDQTGGLRVKGRSGEWLTAHPIRGTLVVNVGDLLARWTNDRFQSTLHAVVNSSGRERYSIAVAVDPDWDTDVRPVLLEGDEAHYEPVQCGAYIKGRFDRSFAYRNAKS